MRNITRSIALIHLTGFKWIAEVIRKLEGDREFIVGGEESYGYMIGENVRDKDAVASCAIISELAAFCKDQGQTCLIA